MYIYICSQITAASDWPRLFLHPRCFCLVIFMLARLHILVVDNRWCQVALKLIIFWLVASTQLLFVRYSLIDDDIFFRSHSWHVLHPFTNFTNQQCCVLKSVGILLTFCLFPF